ncbi:tripartite tricarboxylate transporter TctB family protein [Candidatus Formimonas warabiya]|uniref:DUF1468 domain-containing protein n=1 Tax=Formimonas warabiya TaxID=1761012 RepID=A0A3G1KXU0_FORW1|nr:tripartite tricarboxylate transporter TctB family protein [Candidatus Formimonas warabiya]ATW27217.1 hypothetical protein DCMF_22880 [Candidatus Formimonas warabiya]
MMENRNAIIFHLMLLALFIFLTFMSIGEQIHSFVFPLIILALSIVICILKILALWKKEWGMVLDPGGVFANVDKSSALPTKEENEKEDDEIDQDVTPKEIPNKLSLVSVLVWLIGTVVAYYLVGIVVATGLSIITFMIFLAREKLLRSIVTAIAVPLILHLGFDVLLNMKLFPGIFFK